MFSVKKIAYCVCLSLTLPLASTAFADGVTLPAPTGVVWEGQSPIRLNPFQRIESHFDKISFHYATESVNLVNGWDGNEHASNETAAREWKALKAQPITASLPGQGQAPSNFYNSYVTVDGVRYKLWQFHFHTHSEHTLGTEGEGTPYEGEVHFVHVKLHSDGTPYCIGEPNSLLVIGAFLTKPHRGHPASVNGLTKVLNGTLPSKASESPVRVENIDLAKILPKNSLSWRYDGSLTAPTTVKTGVANNAATGCITTYGNTSIYSSDAAYQLTTAEDPKNGIFPEVVSWVVLQKPIVLTDGQIQALETAVGDNARPVQDAHGRKVNFSFTE